MIKVERLLHELQVLSCSGYGYVLTCEAVKLRLAYGEDREPSLKDLQQEICKRYPCSYSSFRKAIERISMLAWKQNRQQINQYAHCELEEAPTAKEFIEILYTYFLRNREQECMHNGTREGD